MRSFDLRSLLHPIIRPIPFRLWVEDRLRASRMSAARGRATATRVVRSRTSTRSTITASTPMWM
jgi:hypothetical protein